MRLKFFSPKLAFAETWRLLALFLLCAGLSVIPVVGTLGYFSSLILAPVMSLLALGLGRASVQRVQDPKRTKPAARPLIEILQSGRLALAIFLLLPILCFTLSLAWNRNCDYLGGLSFYCVGPMCSTLFAWSWGVAAEVWSGQIYGQFEGQSKGSTARKAWIAAGIAYGAWLLSTALGLYWLYVGPALFAFDPFWGWFSGPIYDEVVFVDARYLRYRGYNALSLALLWLGVYRAAKKPRPSAWDPKITALGLALGLAVGWVFVHRNDYGFGASIHSLKVALPKTKITPHFRIHYAPGSDAMRHIDELAAEHEFAWERLAKLLKDSPRGRVDSFIFPNVAQKRRLLGAGHVEVSLPWRAQMYVNEESWPPRVLHHELAHAFSRRFGDSLFGLSLKAGEINGAMVEGFATALTPRSYAGLDLHDQAAILDRIDKRPELAPLMGYGFWQRASSRAYIASGSFCLWLRENYGIQALIDAYGSGGDLRQATGKSLDTLQSEWIAMLRQRPLTEADIESQRARFSRRSVFARPCAHRIASALEKVAKADRDDDVAKAIAGLQRICELEPQTISHRLRLANYLADHFRYSEAQKVIADTLDWKDLKARERARLQRALGDLAWRNQDPQTALQHYDKAMADLQGSSRAREVAVKRLAVSGSPTQRQALFDYFFPSSPDEHPGASHLRALHAVAQLQHDPPSQSLAHYLQGLRLLQYQLVDAAIFHLSRAVEAPAESSGLPTPALERAAQVQYRRALLLNHAFDEAKALQEKMNKQWQTRSGHRLQDQQWTERIRFYREYFAKPIAEGQPSP